MIMANQGITPILVRHETTPNDIHGMAVSGGILTERGGSTSHAAVICRGMGIPSIVGCADIDINEKAGTVKIGNKTFNKGKVISIDGRLVDAKGL